MHIFYTINVLHNILQILQTRVICFFFAATPSHFPQSQYRHGILRFVQKKSSRNETLQILRASAQKFSRHGSETRKAMSHIESGGVAAKREFLGGLSVFF